MNARIFTGTLLGPDGETVGRWVKFEAAHNLQGQIDYLLEGLRMAAQADSATEARRLAQDVLEGHERSIALMGSSH